MSRKREIVKWFQRLKGYGFIEAEDGAVDVFTHYTIEDGSNSFRHLYQNQELNLNERRRTKRA
ncbi:MAG: cold shock domain-containing protein [Candidatus Promineifilaceae bacterium]